MIGGTEIFERSHFKQIFCYVYETFSSMYPMKKSCEEKKEKRKYVRPGLRASTSSWPGKSSSLDGKYAICQMKFDFDATNGVLPL